ncbi:electron transfer flavoprotein-ubiquinone oxidoreductase [Alloalcanivorax profundimaris]|uniref:electron transfer flavoprotein-ubiquinone oxidoreductase n=1 Tax=Alloalcanivorax profundimaris TaxID=2735259 RepID=UPI000C4967B8|nr:electron transfer flavoprotein-ubiquinone oxidoreductase [Alloalcanivorax profundimaris]MBF1800548.1 electron transfer flavoprotein-ubiquinone oxidoreductase [Alloalcanivorax profundimaris]MBM1144034.1 electron transfer flavoprotein-ubiquinone oxidoreductase [Alcanivorax sp. ZXX171]MBU60720.1 electron transfer flavoprotein-ubiquinone oxidoreductase [Alcanivorax sp.]
MERESMEVDVVIVGAGPSGLATACRLGQIAQESGQELSVVVVEKGSEVGAHILSGAVFEPRALNELFPDWKDKGAPLNAPVTADEIYYFTGADKASKVPGPFAPKTMHNEGNYVISLGNLCRWLAEQAEGMGIEIFPGFPASEVLYHEDGSVKGIATGQMGVAADGEHKPSYDPGMELHAKYTVFSEGCRGHLGKELMEKYNLREGVDPQHYGIGIKELWEIDPSKHQKGLVMHSAGWPLSESGSPGGAFLYHLEDNQVTLGLITDLAYSNPHVSPFDEMQRWKTHPEVKKYLEGGKRVSYGARAIAKGGLQSLPKMTFPGGILVGCDAGTLNFAKIKGNHTAMKSGMMAAETIAKAIADGRASDELSEYKATFENSWVYEELHQQRNFGPAQHKFGNLLGSAFAFVDLNIFNGKLPFTMRDTTPDHDTLKPADQCKKIDYPKPDGKLTFNKLDSVFLSNTNHEEDQPCHLQLKDPSIPIEYNLPKYNEPAQRYCPAGVYEVVTDEESGDKRFQINAQNCVHCKTCDIKDPTQNINWVAPEGTGGPNYPNM